jgi:hypothetical protein
MVPPDENKTISQPKAPINRVIRAYFIELSNRVESKFITFLLFAFGIYGTRKIRTMHATMKIINDKRYIKEASRNGYLITSHKRKFSAG